MQITRDAKIKVASLKEGTALRLTALDELECLEIIEQDLLLPPDAVFTRNSIAYKSDGTRVAANQPRFEQGQFGQAVMVEAEGTTNNVPNGNFSNGTTGWYTGSSQFYDVMQVIQDSEKGLVLKVHGKSDAIGAWDGLHRDTTPTEFETTAKYIVASVDVKTDSDYQVIDNVNTVLYFHHWVYTVEEGWAKYRDVALGLPSGANNWQRLVLVVDMPATRNGYTVTKHKIVSMNPRTFRGTMYRTNIQIEYRDAPYATSFIDGTRSPETLTIPGSVLNPQEGTVEFWVKPLIVTNYNNFFLMTTSNGRFLLYFNSVGVVRFDYGPNGSGPATPQGTIIANNWYHIVLRWSATTGKQALFVNGVKYEKNLPNGVASSFPSTVSIVNRYSAYIDDLRISSIARSDEEILAAYQSGQPLPIDEYTTYKLDFDNKIRITSDGKLICREYIEV